jgi:3-(3-hydroxy-phenyl)propionate hydroxylase
MGNLLGMFGIDVLILERNAGLSDLPRAISLDDEGLRICQAMG